MTKPNVSVFIGRPTDFEGRPATTVNLHFASYLIRCALQDATLYYPKRAVLADAISANPASPGGVTLRQHIADAIAAAGATRPTSFVRF